MDNVPASPPPQGKRLPPDQPAGLAAAPARPARPALLRRLQRAIGEDQIAADVTGTGQALGPASRRVRLQAAAVLRGQLRGPRALLPFLGPAVIASVAYVDPGNFATNITAGSGFGYQLLWVVLLANVVAMLFQSLSARLGIVTGQNLAELCRSRFPPAVSLAMWAVSEIGAMATDLAEFLGGAIGLALLLGLPLLPSMALIGAATLAILQLERSGFRGLEMVIGGLVGAIGLCYVVELLLVPPDWWQAAHGALLPQIPRGEALTLAVGIFGATVMPHAIFLHSGLTQGRLRARDVGERRRLIRYSNLEVVAALAVAGLINAAMLMMAAAAFSGTVGEVAAIDTAYRTLVPLFGGAAAGVFLLSLLASGVSSSVVGTLAGQMIMQGFLGWRIPIWLRRAVTMAPAFVVIGLGADPTRCLIISQVVLSFVLPVPMVALIWLSRDPRVLGEHYLRGGWAVLAWGLCGITLALNALLLRQTLGG